MMNRGNCDKERYHAEFIPFRDEITGTYNRDEVRRKLETVLIEENRNRIDELTRLIELHGELTVHVIVKYETEDLENLNVKLKHQTKVFIGPECSDGTGFIYAIDRKENYSIIYIVTAHHILCSATKDGGIVQCRLKFDSRDEASVIVLENHDKLESFRGDFCVMRFRSDDADLVGRLKTTIHDYMRLKAELQPRSPEIISVATIVQDLESCMSEIDRQRETLFTSQMNFQLNPEMEPGALFIKHYIFKMHLNELYGMSVRLKGSLLSRRRYLFSKLYKVCSQFHIILDLARGNNAMFISYEPYFVRIAADLKQFISLNLHHIEQTDEDLKSQIEDYFSQNMGNLLNSEVFTIIVSHPHGWPKKVSVGKCIEKEGWYGRLFYDTPTCEGSSGALLLNIGLNGISIHVHSRSERDEMMRYHQKNESSAGFLL